jgi:hypothetical protein
LTHYRTAQRRESTFEVSVTKKFLIKGMLDNEFSRTRDGNVSRQAGKSDVSQYRKKTQLGQARELERAFWKQKRLVAIARFVIFKQI